MRAQSGSSFGLAFAAGLLVFAFTPSCAWAQAASSSAQANANWQVVGRQGIVRTVIVPVSEARDRAAYVREIEGLCPPGGTTCFLNFYTNSTGAVADLPLPEAISNEATAIFRRSDKQGSELFRFSCRLQLSVEDCF